MHTRFSRSLSPTDPSICRWMGALIARVTLSGNKWDFSVDCATRSRHSQLIWWILLLIFNFSVWVAQLPRLPRGAPVSLMKFKFRIPKKEEKNHSNYAVSIRNTAVCSFDSDSDRDTDTDIWNVNRIKLKIDRLTRVTPTDSEARFKAWYNAPLRVLILHVMILISYVIWYSYNTAQSTWYDTRKNCSLLYFFIYS